MSEFFKNHFDKLLLLALVVFFTLLAIYGKSPNAQAMTGNVKIVLGALLGLITGRALYRNSDTNGKDSARIPSSETK